MKTFWNFPLSQFAPGWGAATEPHVACETFYRHLKWAISVQVPCCALDACLPLNETERTSTKAECQVHWQSEKNTCFCLRSDKNKSDDQTQRLIESGPQKAHDNALQPRERMKIKKQHMKLFHYTLRMTFKPVCVMKYLQFSLQQLKQGECCEVFVLA